MTQVNFYDKVQVDAKLDTKADKSTTYTKTEINDALASKADASTTYTKTEINDALASKADASTTYTKTEVDNAINNTVVRTVLDKDNFQTTTKSAKNGSIVCVQNATGSNGFAMSFMGIKSKTGATDNRLYACGWAVVSSILYSLNEIIVDQSAGNIKLFLLKHSDGTSYAHTLALSDVTFNNAFIIEFGSLS